MLFSYIDPLNAVYDKFTADGIRVLFTYAPRNKAALSEESDSDALAELDAWLRETLHAEVISPIEDSLYPGRYLFGTDNHLSAIFWRCLMMQNKTPFLRILLLILMAGFAVLFPAALFAGLSYDVITALILVLLTAALAVLYLSEKGRKGDEP